MEGGRKEGWGGKVVSNLYDLFIVNRHLNPTCLLCKDVIFHQPTVRNYYDQEAGSDTEGLVVHRKGHWDFE